MLARLVLTGLLLIMGLSASMAPVSHATVSTTTPRNDYTGNGATSVYNYTFRIFESSDLLVTKQDTLGVITTLALTTDYTVTGVNKTSGGTVTLVAGNLPSGYKLTIRFNRTPKQSTDLRNQGSFFAETHETKFDELTRYAQQQADDISRSIRLPETETGSTATTQIPTVANRSGKFLGFDDSGNLIANASLEGVAPAYGTWTPSLGGTATYTSRTGQYVKIGRLALVYGQITVNTIGTGSATTISGFPFTTVNSVTGFQVCTVAKTSSLAASVVSVNGVMTIFGSTMILYSRTAAATSDGTNSILGNGSVISFSCVYETAT